MSVGQQGHFMMFFLARRVRPPLLLSVITACPENLLSKHALQKLCAQGVVTGRLINCRQILQLNSALNTHKKKKPTTV